MIGAVSKPVNVLIGGTTDMTVSALVEAGAKRISVVGALTWVAYGAMVEVARRMLYEGRFDYGDMPGMQGIATLLDGQMSESISRGATVLYNQDHEVENGAATAWGNALGTGLYGGNALGAAGNRPNSAPGRARVSHTPHAKRRRCKCPHG